MKKIFFHAQQIKFNFTLRFSNTCDPPLSTFSTSCPLPSSWKFPAVSDGIKFGKLSCSVIISVVVVGVARPFVVIEKDVVAEDWFPCDKSSLSPSRFLLSILLSILQ